MNITKKKQYIIYIYSLIIFMIIKNNYHKEKPKIKITVNKNIQEFGKRRKIENNILYNCNNVFL